MVRWKRALQHPGGPLHPHQQSFKTREAPVGLRWRFGAFRCGWCQKCTGARSGPAQNWGPRRPRALGAPGRSRGANGLRRIVDLPGKSVRRAKTPEFESFSGTPGEYGESCAPPLVHCPWPSSLPKSTGEVRFGLLSINYDRDTGAGPLS